MKILVTGGAGYIGSVVSDYLIENGHEVVILDMFYGEKATPNAKAQVIRGDIGDATLLKKIFSENKIDAVAHLAAFIEVGESVLFPEKYFENNYTKGLELIKAMRTAGTKYMLFSSTAAIYGIPEKIPVQESDATMPINPYGASKLKYEEALLAAQQQGNFDYVALRYFNAGGATELHGQVGSHQTHLIATALQVAVGEREFIELYGDDFTTADGTGIRDYIHVEDIAEAHLKVLEILQQRTVPQATQISENAFNIGTGQGYSNKEVLAAIEKISGKKLKIKIVARREGDPPILVADPKKISAFGWQAQHSALENIVQSAWHWKNKTISGILP